MFHSHRSAVAFAVVMALTLVGCSQQVDDPGAGSVERLRVSGSSTALPLIQLLSDAYQTDDVEFAYLPGLHSGGGIRGVASGDLDIGSVARELAPDEESLELEYVKLADDGVAIGVHPSVKIDGLTSEQVREIYRGEHENWAELGGPDLGIVILDRNEDESAKLAFRQYVLGPELEVTDRAVNLFYEPDMIAGVQHTEGAIGYFSLGFGLTEKIAVNYIELDGVEASVDNIESGDYRMVRPLGIVVARPASGAIADFVQWAQSDEARELMTQSGFAPPRVDTGGQ